MKIALSNHSLFKGDSVSVTVTCEDASNFSQIQLEIYRICIENPSPAIGIGTSPVILSPNSCSVTVNTSSLDFGLYEIKLVRFHSPQEDGNQPDHLDFVSGRDYPRMLFEIIPHIIKPRSIEIINNEVLEKERQIERKFEKPIDIREDTLISTNSYSVFIFVEGLLLGSRTRLGQFEILPSSTGLDGKDYLEFTNSFMENSTSTYIKFDYTEEVKNNSRQNRPVSIVHFPCIIADNEEVAYKYCETKTSDLLLAMSITRGANGNIFDIVVFNHNNQFGTRYTKSKQYAGNLLTGHLSGENPSVLIKYTESLSCNNYYKFLTNLHKEAIGEANHEYKYVRYWALLVLLAEAMNFDENEDLTEFNGIIMVDSRGRNLKKKSEINKVFALFVHNNIGSTFPTWREVNIWYAFRCAVAHFGSLSQAHCLVEKTKYWADLGINEIRKTPGHDHFLWILKEDVKLLLMKLLAQTP